MPLLLTSTTLSAIAKALAARGIDLTSGIFRSQKDYDVSEISELIKTQTGIDIVDAAENKLTENQWTQLKEFEFENQENLLNIRASLNPNEIELERLTIKDKDVARKTQTQRDRHEDPMIRQFTYWYAYLITAATFGFILLSIFLPIYVCRNTVTECKLIPSESWQIINTVLGFLLGVGLSAIIQFFYGSSQSSRDKDNHVRELSRQLSASSDGVEQGEK